jgi:hypothetical protein
MSPICRESPPFTKNSTPHTTTLGAFADRRILPRPGARRVCPAQRRTIAAAGSGRMPNAPRSSAEGRSEAMRRTMGSAISIGASAASELTLCCYGSADRFAPEAAISRKVLKAVLDHRAAAAPTRLITCGHAQ